MKIKIYAGLSICSEEINQTFPNAICAPPIRRGNLEADIQESFNIVGIVDGEFFQSLAIPPTEILFAIRSGVKIYGSSSMGALRAAELNHLGMTGYGKIYEDIKNEKYYRDDYLGLVFQEDLDSEFSIPHVDLTATLNGLLIKGKIDLDLAKIIALTYGELHFSERNLRALRIRLCKSGMPRNRAEECFELIKNNFLSQKTVDARGLIEKMRNDISKIFEVNRLLATGDIE